MLAFACLHALASLLSPLCAFTLQMDTFKARAADHRADINATTENMRQARSDLISKHHESVVSERKVKEAHASALFERHKVAERAKRLVRDAVFSARFVSPDKSKVSLSAQKAQ